MLDPYKNIIDAKLENDNISATGIFTLLVLNYGYKGKYGIVRKSVSSIKEKIITNLTIRFETIKGYQSIFLFLINSVSIFVSALFSILET